MEKTIQGAPGGSPKVKRVRCRRELLPVGLADDLEFVEIALCLSSEC